MIIRSKLPSYRRLKGVNRTSKKIRMISQAILKDLPTGTELLESQVAGHTFQIGTDEIGNSQFTMFSIFILIDQKILSIISFQTQVCLKISKMVPYSKQQ